MRYLTFAWAMLGMLTATARADRVHLSDGAVVEGKAMRQGDRVVVEMESGRLTLLAAEVTRIEQTLSSVQRFEELEATYRTQGVPGWMKLADYCRDHQMRERERRLLQAVIEQAPDHAEARARLGYVKTAAGWTTREELQRAQGLVQDGARFVTPEQQLQTERLRAEARHAELQRDKAALEVEAQKLALSSQQLELERQRASAASTAPTTPPQTPPQTQAQSPQIVYLGAPVHLRDEHACYRGACRPAQRQQRSSAFPISGVRDPRDTSWRIPGVRDPLR